MSGAAAVSPPRLTVWASSVGSSIIPAGLLSCSSFVFKLQGANAAMKNFIHRAKCHASEKYRCFRLHIPLNRILSSNEGASDRSAPKSTALQAPSIGRMVDREAKHAEGKGIGYDRWATMHNLKAWSKTFMYLSKAQRGRCRDSVPHF